jgi:hypothetical protein
VPWIIPPVYGDKAVWRRPGRSVVISIAAYLNTNASTDDGASHYDKQSCSPRDWPVQPLRRPMINGRLCKSFLIRRSCAADQLNRAVVTSEHPPDLRTYVTRTPERAAVGSFQQRAYAARRRPAENDCEPCLGCVAATQWILRTHVYTVGHKTECDRSRNGTVAHLRSTEAG